MKYKLIAEDYRESKMIKEFECDSMSDFWEELRYFLLGVGFHPKTIEQFMGAEPEPDYEKVGDDE